MAVWRNYGARGGFGAKVGFEVQQKVVGLLTSGRPKAEIARVTGVAREHVRRVNLMLGGVYRGVSNGLCKRSI